jgi:hypothetical protein
LKAKKTVFRRNRESRDDASFAGTPSINDHRGKPIIFVSQKVFVMQSRRCERKESCSLDINSQSLFFHGWISQGRLLRSRVVSKDMCRELRGRKRGGGSDTPLTADVYFFYEKITAASSVPTSNPTNEWVSWNRVLAFRDRSPGGMHWEEGFWSRPGGSEEGQFHSCRGIVQESR